VVIESASSAESFQRKATGKKQPNKKAGGCKEIMRQRNEKPVLVSAHGADKRFEYFQTLYAAELGLGRAFWMRHHA
jgi:hypothetical protein